MSSQLDKAGSCAFTEQAYSMFVASLGVVNEDAQQTADSARVCQMRCDFLENLSAILSYQLPSEIVLNWQGWREEQLALDSTAVVLSLRVFNSILELIIPIALLDWLLRQVVRCLEDKAILLPVPKYDTEQWRVQLLNRWLGNLPQLKNYHILVVSLRQQSVGTTNHGGTLRQTISVSVPDGHFALGVFLDSSLKRRIEAYAGLLPLPTEKNYLRSRPLISADIILELDVPTVYSLVTIRPGQRLRLCRTEAGTSNITARDEIETRCRAQLQFNYLSKAEQRRHCRQGLSMSPESVPGRFTFVFEAKN